MFISRFQRVGRVELPPFEGIRVMLPIVMNDIGLLPDFLSKWRGTIGKLVALSNCKSGVGLLTIDEKLVQPGKVHHRAGLHVDENCNSGGSRGMLTVSSHVGCRAFYQPFIGYPDDDGECEHLRDQCIKGVNLQPGVVYWLDNLCVHESLPMKVPTLMQFVGLVMPTERCDRVVSKKYRVDDEDEDEVMKWRSKGILLNV